MDSEDWKTLGKALVSKGLPLLGAVVGGPAGPALSAAGALISSVLGEENADNPTRMLQAMNASPATILELKKLETQHRENLQQLAFQQDQAYLNDVQNARGREIAVTQVTGKKDTNLYVLAWTVIIGFLGSILLLAFAKSPFTNNQAALLLLGALATGFGSVLHYFFGSSRGSKEKTQAMANMLDGGK